MNNETQEYELTREQALAYRTSQHKSTLLKRSDWRLTKIIIVLAILFGCLYFSTHYIDQINTPLVTGN